MKSSGFAEGMFPELKLRRESFGKFFACVLVCFFDLGLDLVAR